VEVWNYSYVHALSISLYDGGGRSVLQAGLFNPECQKIDDVKFYGYKTARSRQSFHSNVSYIFRLP